MPSIVLVSPRAEAWLGFTNALKKSAGVEIDTVGSGAEAVARAHSKQPLAMVIDQDIQDMAGLDLIRQLMSINAMINVAWASELSEDQFHETTEGLGIIMKLSPQPDSNEARILAERLGQITGAI